MCGEIRDTNEEPADQPDDSEIFEVRRFAWKRGEEPVEVEW